MLFTLDDEGAAEAVREGAEAEAAAQQLHLEDAVTKIQRCWRTVQATRVQAQLARETGAESSAESLLVREAVAPLLARLDAGAAATDALAALLGGVDRETGKLELAARALESAAVRMVELFERRDGILFDGPHRAVQPGISPVCHVIKWSSCAAK